MKTNKELGVPEARGMLPEDPCAQISDEALVAELQRRIANHSQAIEELKAVNEELLKVNKKLEESESLKSHFISNITNEIINPFTSILGLSRAILTVDKEAWKKVISMVALIHSEAFSLDFQFRNIFFAARIEAGEEHPEALSVEIVSVVENVIEGFKFELRKRRMRVELCNQLPSGDNGEPYRFTTDPGYLKLILSNLLSNAVNFSLEDDRIEITLRLEGEELCVDVQDWGIGIAEDRLAMIFDRFTRADSSINSVNRGHGLGLSVTRAVVELLGGSLSVESKLGEGSCFHVRIPESPRAPEGLALEANEIFFNEEETF